MGVPVLILGESGTGKSASLRNFKAEDLKVINVANKPLPFKNKFESISTDSYKEIIKEMKLNKKKVLVIDDAQYLMANEFMRRATERGYDKFTEIAQNFWNLVNTVKDLPNDVVVYFLAHIERDPNGNEKIKTIGKLLDEKITVEGMFTIVLKTNVTDGVYSFLTQNSGHDTVKSPIGMFPSYAIDNDLKYVDEKIRNYYELGEFLTDEEIKEIDEAVKKDDVPFEEPKKRGRSRGKKKEEEPAETPKEEESSETEKPEEKPKRSRRNKDDISDDNGANERIDGESAEKPKRSRRKAEAEEFMNIPEDAGDDKSFKKEDEELPKRKTRKATKEPDNLETPEEAPRRRRRRTN